MAKPAEPGHVIEQGRRLSESTLWRLQREFYDVHDMRATVIAELG